MSAAGDRRRGVPQSGKPLTLNSRPAAHESRRRSPRPTPTGMETRSEGERGPASWAPFRHLQAITGLLGRPGLLEPGFGLRKAHFFCDHQPV